MGKVRVMEDISESDVAQFVILCEQIEGVTVEKEKQDNGKWKVTVTYPNGEESSKD